MFYNLVLLLNWFEQKYLLQPFHCSMLYLARISVSQLWCSKLPCVQIALPFKSVSYQERCFCGLQNCGHRYVFLTEIETVWAALCMCLEIQKARVSRTVIPHRLCEAGGIESNNSPLLGRVDRFLTATHKDPHKIRLHRSVIPEACSPLVSSQTQQRRNVKRWWFSSCLRWPPPNPLCDNSQLKHTQTHADTHFDDMTLSLWIVTLAEQQMQYFTLCGHCTTKCS